MLDLFLRQIGLVVGLERSAEDAAALLGVTAHLWVTWALDLALLTPELNVDLVLDHNWKRGKGAVSGGGSRPSRAHLLGGR